MAFHRELTVLQCFGVPFRAFAHPLWCMVLAVEIVSIPLFPSSRHAPVLAIASVLSSMLAALVIVLFAWRWRERGVYAGCAAGIALQAASVAAAVGLAGFLQELH
jgi:hypothetical protein